MFNISYLNTKRSKYYHKLSISYSIIYFAPYHEVFKLINYNTDNSANYTIIDTLKHFIHHLSKY